MRNAVEMAIFVLDKYYRLSEAVPAYSGALLLDPSKQKQYMKKTWKLDDMNKAIRHVQSVWEGKYKNSPAVNESQRQQQRQQQSREHHTNKKGKEREETAFSSIRAEIRETRSPVQRMDEFLSFIEADSVDLEAYNMTPIEWWCLEKNRNQYPRLFKMALDILSIPPMSDAPERTFSCGRRTVPWSRARLKAENIEMVESVANWVSHGFIPDQGMKELLDSLSDPESDESGDDLENSDGEYW
jgi:hAT family C-terminal dimerisation region